MDSAPLTTMLSQTLVAYTIEFDNESEHRMPHRTTVGGPSARAGDGPWLVSMAMWFNCMRHVGATPISVQELERRARTPTNLAGMRRWRYIDVEADPDDPRASPPESALQVRVTRKGHVAQQVLQPLVRDIEVRWEERWGTAQIAGLRSALIALVRQSDLDLPDCLPILGYGLWSAGPSRPAFDQGRTVAQEAETLALPALVARSLLTIAVAFEARSKVSLAIHADVLRVLGEQPVPVRDLPRLSGISKEAVSMAMGVLMKRGLVVLEPDPSGRPGKAARLTPKGIVSQREHGRLLHAVEQQLEPCFGADVVGALRATLEPLVGDSRGSGLFPGLEPYPDGWRASVRKPEILPHFPTVLHRGGYPDGR